MRFVPKRHWFQFSVRTLLALTAVVAVVLAYHVRWIQQRRALLAHDSVYDRTEASAKTPVVRRRAPGLLWLMGEQGVNRLVVTEWHVDADRLEAQAHDLFPEAEISKGGFISVVEYTR